MPLHAPHEIARDADVVTRRIAVASKDIDESLSDAGHVPQQRSNWANSGEWETGPYSLISQDVRFSCDRGDDAMLQKLRPCRRPPSLDARCARSFGETAFAWLACLAEAHASAPFSCVSEGWLGDRETREALCASFRLFAFVRQRLRLLAVASIGPFSSLGVCWRPFSSVANAMTLEMTLDAAHLGIFRR